MMGLPRKNTSIFFLNQRLNPEFKFFKGICFWKAIFMPRLLLKRCEGEGFARPSGMEH